MVKESLSYREFSEKFHQKLFMKGIPSTCQIELTHRCNHNCVYCYIPLEDLKGKNSKKEWDTQQWKSFLDFISHQGIQWLSFTGGEPLLRKDFIDIYIYAKKKGFFISVLTNGGAIDNEIIEVFKRHRPFQIEVTLNSLNKETFEKITNIPSSYQRVIFGIELLIKHHLPLRLKTKLMNLNNQELESIKNFAESLGIKWGWSYLIAPKLNGNLSPLSYRLEPKEIAKKFLQKKGLKEKQKVKEYDFKSNGKSNPLFRCGIGKWSFTVTPYGEIIPCTLLRLPSFPFSPETFSTNFKKFFFNLRNSSFKTNSPCRNCKLFNICNWCPALAYLEKGNLEESLDYYCNLAMEYTKTSHSLT